MNDRLPVQKSTLFYSGNGCHMVNQFSIRSRIYSGENALQTLQQYAGQRVGIVTDSFMVSSGLINRITEQLAQCETAVFSEVKPDPSIDVLQQGARFFYELRPQVIIAFGGGSSLDAAKGIAATLNTLGIVDSIVLVAIPTTSGSGSEVTTYAIISDPANNIKYPLVSEDLLPDVAILDSSLVMSVPRGVSMDTGMDVMTHAIEALVSINANDFSDALAEKSLRMVHEYLPQVFHDLNNQYAREKVHHASCLAGMAFNSAGLGLVHGMAHALGALLHIAHGKINAMLLPIIIKFNSQDDEHIRDRYALCARIMDLQNQNNIMLVQQLVKQIQRLNKMMGIPASLKELGSDIGLLRQNLQEVITAVLNDSCTKTNPKSVNATDIEYLIEQIIG